MVPPRPAAGAGPARALLLQGLGLGVEHVLEPVADEPPAAVDGGPLDDRQDLAVGGGVGQLLQLADHRQRLLDGGGLDLVLGRRWCGGYMGRPP